MKDQAAKHYFLSTKLYLISGLIGLAVLIFFMPVLMWSPPWSDHGYYCGNNVDDFVMYFENGHVKLIDVQDSGQVHGELFEYYHEILDGNNVWRWGSFSTFVHSGTSIKFDGEEAAMKKTSNPFKVWCFVYWELNAVYY